jgi:hypothetical protein
MPRYIDADLLLERIYPYNGVDKSKYAINAKAVFEAIRKSPTADVVEVVRCKDCKFNVANMEKDPLDITDYSGDDIVCSYFMTDGLEPADFCSHGAKMKGGEDNA